MKLLYSAEVNQKLLFYAAAFGVALVLIGLTRLTTTTDGLLAAAGAYDEYGYNRIAREFKGSGANWCLAHNLDRSCFDEYTDSTYFIKWNAEWDRGNREAWVLPPYNAEIVATTDGQSYTVRWVGICYEGEVLPGGGTCVWGEYEARAENGSGVHQGPFGAWLRHAIPNQI